MRKEIEGYKGFNKDLTCRGFQYEEGKTYKHRGKVEVCNEGFHFCENPIDIFRFYPPGESIFHKVVGAGELKSEEDIDTKIACSEITIKASISLHDLIGDGIKFFFNRKYKRKTAKHSTGDRSASSATGYQSASSATGDRSASSATGYQSASSATGDRSASSATGDWSASSSTQPHRLPVIGQPHQLLVIGQPHRLPVIGQPHQLLVIGQPHQLLVIVVLQSASEQNQKQWQGNMAVSLSAGITRERSVLRCVAPRLVAEMVAMES